MGTQTTPHNEKGTCPGSLRPTMGCNASSRKLHFTRAMQPRWMSSASRLPFVFEMLLTASATQEERAQHKEVQEPRCEAPSQRADAYNNTGARRLYVSRRTCARSTACCMHITTHHL